MNEEIEYALIVTFQTEQSRARAALAEAFGIPHKAFARFLVKRDADGKVVRVSLEELEARCVEYERQQTQKKEEIARYAKILSEDDTVL